MKIISSETPLTLHSLLKNYLIKISEFVQHSTNDHMKQDAV